MIDRVVPGDTDLLGAAKAFMTDIIAGKADLRRDAHDFSEVDAAVEKARQAPLSIENVVKAGRLGRKKSGKGFFLDDGRVDPAVLPLIPVPEEKPALTPDDIQDMLFRPFVEVGRRLLEQGIVSDPRAVDAGAIWGIGFPADKGGPLKWSDLTGLSRELYGTDFYPT